VGIARKIIYRRRLCLRLVRLDRLDRLPPIVEDIDGPEGAVCIIGADGPEGAGADENGLKDDSPLVDPDTLDVTPDVTPDALPFKSSHHPPPLFFLNFLFLREYFIYIHFILIRMNMYGSFW
jgi:hypothetical protein